MWQFQEAVRGIAEACRVLEVPVVSGAVSLYNQTSSGAILPTPTVAMVGVAPDLGQLPVSRFLTPKQRIILLGPETREFGGSAYLRLLHGVEQGMPPSVDLALETRLAEVLRLAVYEGWVTTACDVSSGGLGVALARACLAGGLGARVNLGGEPLDLFSESQGRVILAVDSEHAEEVLAEAEAADVPARDVGEVGGKKIDVKMAGGKIALGVEELHRLWSTALPRALEV
jgi:phosphoribosylformylglycinamidine synthase